MNILVKGNRKTVPITIGTCSKCGCVFTLNQTEEKNIIFKGIIFKSEYYNCPTMECNTLVPIRKMYKIVE